MRSHISVHRATTKSCTNSFVFKNEIEKEGLPRDSPAGLGTGGPRFKSGPRPIYVFCFPSFMDDCIFVEALVNFSPTGGRFFQIIQCPWHWLLRRGYTLEYRPESIPHFSRVIPLPRAVLSGKASRQCGRRGYTICGLGCGLEKSAPDARRRLDGLH
jgi:hypothetical protein